RKVSVTMRAGMEANKVGPDVIEKILQSITSFALYGFPESHAISFAILAYGSAYLKAHRAPEFYASLLNNQPMGFYTPATIVKDAQRHGVKMLPVCARQSSWVCTVVSDDTVRLGFCVVNGMRKEHGEALVAERERAAFGSLDEFKRRAPFTKEELRTLAELGALNCFAEHRRAAMWRVEEQPPEPLFGRHPERSVAQSNDPVEAGVASQPIDARWRPSTPLGMTPLPAMSMPERVKADYTAMNLTTGPHPMKLLRAQLPDIWRATDLR